MSTGKGIFCLTISDSFQERKSRLNFELKSIQAAGVNHRLLCELGKILSAVSIELWEEMVRPLSQRGGGGAVLFSRTKKSFPNCGDKCALFINGFYLCDLISDLQKDTQYKHTCRTLWRCVISFSPILQSRFSF